MVATTRCIHRWLLAPVAGPTSLGECCKCGAKREFSNLEPLTAFVSMGRPHKTSAASVFRKGGSGL